MKNHTKTLLSWGFPGHLVLPTQGKWVQSLVGKLRSHVGHGVIKNIYIKFKKYSVVLNSVCEPCLDIALNKSTIKNKHIQIREIWTYQMNMLNNIKKLLIQLCMIIMLWNVKQLIIYGINRWNETLIQNSFKVNSSIPTQQRMECGDTQHKIGKGLIIQLDSNNTFKNK